MPHHACLIQMLADSRRCQAPGLVLAARVGARVLTSLLFMPARPLVTMHVQVAAPGAAACANTCLSSARHYCMDKPPLQQLSYKQEVGAARLAAGMRPCGCPGVAQGRSWRAHCGASHSCYRDLLFLHLLLQRKRLRLPTNPLPASERHEAEAGATAAAQEVPLKKVRQGADDAHW